MQTQNGVLIQLYIKHLHLLSKYVKLENPRQNLKLPQIMTHKLIMRSNNQGETVKLNSMYNISYRSMQHLPDGKVSRLTEATDSVHITWVT